MIRRMTAVCLVLLWNIPFSTYAEIDLEEVRNVQTTIRSIYNAARMYEQDRGVWPDNLERLVEIGWITLDRNIGERWEFSLEGCERIFATSTNAMDVGAGYIIEFDVGTGQFSGYGTERAKDIADVQSSLGAVYNAARMCEMDTGNWPETVSGLVQYGYLTLDESVAANWEFELEGREKIIAISKASFADGAGNRIELDLAEMEFLGYGIVQQEE